MKPSSAFFVMTGRAQMDIPCNHNKALGARCPKPAVQSMHPCIFWRRAFATTDRVPTCMRALFAQHSHDDAL
eukprot:scaffold409012_cov19-Prasinocladus_malaysianus.AAC.1